MQAIQRARWRVRDTLGERDRGMRREKEREQNVPQSPQQLLSKIRPGVEGGREGGRGVMRREARGE